MIEKKNKLVVYCPSILNEALGFLASYPEAKVYAGGTARHDHITSPLTMPSTVLSIHLLNDLKKITYNNRFLELGAGLVLNQILCVDRSFVHPLLQTSLMSIGHSSLRNLATVGGNLCQNVFSGDLFPVFSLLGTQCEIRSSRSSRWINITPSFQKQKPKPGEILTRIRIPQEEWSHHFYQKIGHFHTPWEESLTMLALANLKEFTLDSFRLAFYMPHSGILRDDALEILLTRQKLPLDTKSKKLAFELMDKAISNQRIPCSVFQSHRILYMVHWLLSQLSS